MSGRVEQAWVDQARAVSLVALVARRVKLRRAGRGWSGLCPFHEEKTPSFTVTDEKGFFHCFGCGAHGDAIEWVMETEGCSFRVAVEQLVGGRLPSGEARPVVRRRALERPSDIVSSAAAGRWIFATSVPARGELVERWLEARGCEPRAEFLPGHAAIDQLRFHPRCPVAAWGLHDTPDDPRRLTAPAMIAPIADGDGAVRGVHVTYLSADGRAKAALGRTRDGRARPTRKIFGRVGGHAAFLTPHEEMARGESGRGAELLVGEGIETVWSVGQALGRPCRAVAALSLSNLQGGAVKLKDGSLPLWRIEADAGAAPFVLPDAGRVAVLVDADMKPLKGQKLQRAQGAKPVRGEISGAERTAICASLAAQAWRRAGAEAVRVLRPRMGFDFNDEARAA